MSKSHWEKELEKDSLKEPPMKSKLLWIKPLTTFHSLEYRGIDERDKYEPKEIDEWDAQVWNLTTRHRTKCKEYLVDYTKCVDYLNSEFITRRGGYRNQHRFCWKPFLNYQHCLEDHGHHHPEDYLKGSKLGH